MKITLSPSKNKSRTHECILLKIFILPRKCLGLATNLAIKCSTRRTAIGVKPIICDTEGDKTEKSPTDKAGVKAEESPLVVFHKLL